MAPNGLHWGIESMLRLNDMTMEDVEIVEFPYPEIGTMTQDAGAPNQSDRPLCHAYLKRDLAFRPLEMALLEGKVDAIYTLSKQFLRICRRIRGR